MKKLFATALVSAALIPAAVFAQVKVGDSIGASEDIIRSALEAKGYQIIEFEIEDGEIELEAMFDSQEYEIEVSSETGIVTEVELED